MADQNWLSIPLLDTITQSNWWWIAVGCGYGVLRLVEYISRRLMEGKPESERVDHLMRWADLQKKLDDNKMNLDDLEALRMRALGKKIEGSALVAEQYSSITNRLIADAKSIFPNRKKITYEKYEEKDISIIVHKKSENAMSQMDMNIASFELFLGADRELAAVLLEISATASPEELQALRNAHEAWIDYRKAEAEREAAVWEGGSIRPLLYNSAMEAITRERLAQLRNKASEPSDLVHEKIVTTRKNTPINILEHIIVGVPRDRVEQILGVPYLILGDNLYYSYQDTQIEIRFRLGAVETVSIALCQGHTYFGTQSTGITEIPLGRLTMADVLEKNHSSLVEYSLSMRTKEIFVRLRVGPPGAWVDYCFGSLVVFSGAGRLQEIEFDWDDDSGKLLTDPKKVLINYISTDSLGGGPPSFAWFIY
jgi:uncharacterized protein YecT (DUF1311 family)